MATFSSLHFLNIIAAALALLLFACHDAPRKNPFDPALTPSVELVSAQLDSTRGSALIEWSPYAGDQPFAHYLLLRRRPELTAIDTVALIDDPAQTTFVDESISIYNDYLYQIWVVNQSGFAVASAERAIGALDLTPVALEDPAPNPQTGTITLRWRRYSGPRFERYEIRRIAFDSEGSRDEPSPDTPFDPEGSQGGGLLLGTIALAADTSFVDGEALPGTSYFYVVSRVIDGVAQQSEAARARYELPTVELAPVTFDHQTARAELSWQQYQGPRFARYEIWRRTPGRSEERIAELAGLETVVFTDSLLDGNTEYTYRVDISTTWTDISTRSNEVSGAFFTLEEQIELPAVDDAELRAMDLKIDESDRLFAVATTILTTTARTMQPGIKVLFPDARAYRTYFTSITPARLAPIFMALDNDRVYLVTQTEDDSLFIGAIDTEANGRITLWPRNINSNGEPPAGIHIDENGDILVFDAQGIIYFVSEDGQRVTPNTRINAALEGEGALPVRHMTVGPGIGPNDLDQFFFLVPQRDGNHIVARSRVSAELWGGKGVADDGVGVENGQTLTPLRIAYDATQTRLVVIDELGRLQLLRANASVEGPRYITKWGQFGSGPGEFFVSPPTVSALAVDSRGYIYVGDGLGERGRVQVFSP